MWAIWTSRNRFIHEGELKWGSQIADFVINYFKELDGLDTHQLVRRIHTDRWVAPNGLMVRINFDTFVFAAEAMACPHALNLRLNLRLGEVEIERNSRSVIRKL